MNPLSSPFYASVGVVTNGLFSRLVGDNTSKGYNKNNLFGAIVLVLVGFLMSFQAFSQTKSKQQIEIISAGALTLDSLNHQRARKLVGNVKLKQDEVTMSCDSAYFYVDINAVDAFGHVHIFDEQTHVYSDTLNYDGDKKLAKLFGDVKVVQEDMHLSTQQLIYYTEKKEAIYYDGGKITGKDLRLTSKMGYYYSQSQDMYFRDSIVLVNDRYRITTDSMRYNMSTEKTYFFGPTEIVREGNHIYCESGWHDNKTDISVFGKNTVMREESQILYCDSLHYNNKHGFGRAYKNFRWTDTTMKVILSGQKADYYEKNQNITATEEALLIYEIDGDSLFLTADTLKSRTDTIRDFTEFFAFHHVRVYKKNLQGLCDSLFFTFKDSTIRMYRDPVLWNEKNQMTGDTITISLKHNKIDQVEFFENGFIINEAAEGVYNQIKGKHIYGYFKNDELDKLLVEGSGESLYYATDDQDAFIGLNKAICSNMWIYMKDEAVNKISFLTKPEATFYPIQDINVNNYLLKNFKWRAEERPMSKVDLFMN